MVTEPRVVVPVTSRLRTLVMAEPPEPSTVTVEKFSVRFLPLPLIPAVVVRVAETPVLERVPLSASVTAPV